MLKTSSPYPVYTPADLGNAIRKARKAQQLSQAELAELAGVGTRFFSERERGKDSVQLGLALHVARLAGVDIAVLYRQA